jgi:FkbM family methyltransferase
VTNEYAYHLSLSWKTKLFNKLRTPFKKRPLEALLAYLTRSCGFPFTKLVPPEYTYPADSWRTAKRNGLIYRLNLSNYVDHKIYFSLETEGLTSLLSLIRPNFHIVDIGANIGQVTIPCASRAYKGRVLSFEPDPKNQERLQQNLNLNRFQNVEIVPKGLGRSPDTLTLCRVNPNNPGMNRILADTESRFDSTLVEITTLDLVLDEKSWKKLDFIKIDVEGFEMQVLLGASKTLSRFKPTLFIELDDKNLSIQGSSARHLVMWLLDKGYTVFNAAGGEAINPKTSELSGCHVDILCKPQSESQGL